MNEQIKLSELAKGAKAVVKDVSAPRVIKKKFMDMGLVAGVKVEIKRFAPLGDPIEIALRGYNLCLRKKEASMVLVEVINDEK